MQDLEWARPAGTWALLAPLVLLLFLRLRNRPPERVTGTLALWRQVTEGVPRTARLARHAIPPWGWVCVLALLAGALALAGPRPAPVTVARAWRVVVDPTPSLGLAWRAAPGPDVPESETRLDRALAAARAWLAAHAASTDRVRWSRPGEDDLELAPDEAPPPAWLAPRPFASAPDPRLHDEPGTLWITDRAPDLELENLGVFASGGAAVHGPVAVDGRDRIDWDGERLVTLASVLPPGRLVRESPREGAWPGVLRRLLDVWADVRGFEVVDDAGTRATDRQRLTVRLEAGAGEERTATLGRDGWHAPGTWRAPLAGGAATSDVWLAGPADGALVRGEPGVVRVALVELGEPDGDPAAFAVSWGRLLDRWTLPPDAVVALSERADAGEPLTRAPAFPGGADAEAEGSAHELDAWLAALAAVLGGVGLSMRR